MKDELKECFARINKDFDELGINIKALQADRKRLNWLLENEYNVYESGTGDFYVHDGGEALMQNPNNYNYGWETARAAIDAAIKESQ